MKTELQYRTFQQLVESATLDIPHLGLEGAFDPQQLLKVVTKINYLLGLRVSPNRLRLLELRHGKVRLPDDFSVANYALLCAGATPTPRISERELGYRDGVQSAEHLAGALDAYTQTSATGGATFTVTRTLSPGSNTVAHPLNTTTLLVQAVSPAGEFVSFQVFFPTPGTVVIFSEAEYPVENVTLTFLSGRQDEETDPTTQPCRERCEVVDTQGQLLVRYTNSWGRREEHRVRTPLRFVRSKGVSSECDQLFPLCREEVSLQSGFLVVPGQEGHVLLSYVSVLEDEEGNLLTLDHPKVNDYYEYAIKARVYENLWLAGEDVQQKLAYLKTELRTAKYEGLSFVNTPNFADFKKMWELNRKAQHQKYYSLFQTHGR